MKQLKISSKQSNNAVKKQKKLRSIYEEIMNSNYNSMSKLKKIFMEAELQ